MYIHSVLSFLLGISTIRSCETDWDCSLAGSCDKDQSCKCDPGWQGTTCAQLKFKDAPSVGYAFRPGPGFTTWGGSPIQADNRSLYYLFASVNINGTLADWWNSSVVVSAVSRFPAGPYYWDRRTVTIGPRLGLFDGVAIQNPVVVRLRNGAGFVIFYAGTNVTTPHYGMTNCGIGAAFSTSLDGPWERPENPVLVAYASPESWEKGAVANPAAYVHDDNSITLAYRGYWENNGIGFAWAPSWRGPFQRLYEGSGLFAERPTLEDPYLFMTPRGFHVLMHYFRVDNCTRTDCPLVGNHAFARAAPRSLHSSTEFYLTPNSGTRAGGYGLFVQFANGSTSVFSHREEPKMLLEWSDAASDYVPTHLFNVVIQNQTAPANGWKHLESYILAQPLAGDMQPPREDELLQI